MQNNQKLLEKILLNPSNRSLLKIEIKGDECNLVCSKSKKKIGFLNRGVLEFSKKKFQR